MREIRATELLDADSGDWIQYNADEYTTIEGPLAVKPIHAGSSDHILVKIGSKNRIPIPVYIPTNHYLYLERK